jgi:hypothetical protein
LSAVDEEREVLAHGDDLLRRVVVAPPLTDLNVPSP